MGLYMSTEEVEVDALKMACFDKYLREKMIVGDLGIDGTKPHPFVKVLGKFSLLLKTLESLEKEMAYEEQHPRTNGQDFLAERLEGTLCMCLVLQNYFRARHGFWAYFTHHREVTELRRVKITIPEILRILEEIVAWVSSGSTYMIIVDVDGLVKVYKKKE